MFLLLLSALATASTDPLVMMPLDAAPVDAWRPALLGPTAAGAGGFHGQATLSGTVGGALRLDQSLGDHLFLHASAGVLPGIGVGEVALGVRVLERPAMRVALTVGAAGLGGPDGYAQAGPTAGVAVDAGSANLRVDASVPLFLDLEDGTVSPVRTAQLGAVGVRWLAGEHQVLRLGTSPGQVADLSWAWVADRWHVGAGAGWYGTSPLGHVSAGISW